MTLYESVILIEIPLLIILIILLVFMVFSLEKKIDDFDKDTKLDIRLTLDADGLTYKVSCGWFDEGYYKTSSIKKEEANDGTAGTPD